MHIKQLTKCWTSSKLSTNVTRNGDGDDDNDGDETGERARTCSGPQGWVGDQGKG